ncbi:kinase-like domain-containing protein [Syncephalis fuscata]|nr:kinase-like domain-containing protein [Syncephalis fuscata]
MSSTSAPTAPAAVAVQQPLNLLSDEDLMFYNVPEIWNTLSMPMRANTIAWARIHEAGSKKILLIKNRNYTVGAGGGCNCPLATNSVPAKCFKFLVSNGFITFKNIELDVLMVNGIELGAIGSRRVAGDCVVTIPGHNITFNIYIIKRYKPVKIEDSKEYEKKINQKFMLVDKPIGEGAFGQVYMGFDRSTGERVAVKVSSKESGLKSFNNEVATLRAVGNHPGVIGFLDGTVTALNTYLSLEYATGGDLINHIVSKAPLPEMEAKYIFKQLLEGIQHLHSMNIIHRDIKPDNMLLFGGQGGPRVVFTDFGMACILPPSLTVTTFCGTVAYMAPEVLLGTNRRENMEDIIKSMPGAKDRLPSALLNAKGYGKPADMWGLGATLHTMLLGKCKQKQKQILTV